MSRRDAKLYIKSSWGMASTGFWLRAITTSCFSVCVRQAKKVSEYYCRVQEFRLYTRIARLSFNKMRIWVAREYHGVSERGQLLPVRTPPGVPLPNRARQRRAY